MCCFQCNHFSLHLILSLYYFCAIAISLSYFIFKKKMYLANQDNLFLCWFCNLPFHTVHRVIKTRGEGDNRGWDGWMASLTQCTWVWVNSRSWQWTGRPGVLQSIGSQGARHDWASELNWTVVCNLAAFIY